MKTKKSARLLKFAKRMRKLPTFYENRVRSILMKGFYNRDGIKTKINFQRPFYFEDLNYIVDVYFPKYRVAVEIDGGVHNSQENYDTNRDIKMMKRGILVIRFDNNLIIKEPTKFFNQVRKTLISRGWSE